MEKNVESHIENEKDNRIKHKIQDHKDCLDLAKKIEYAINNPISNPQFICQISNLFFPFFNKKYYSQCDEFLKFIEENNKTNQVGVSILEPYYVNWVDVNIDVYNECI